MGLSGLESRASGETLGVRFLYSPYNLRSSELRQDSVDMNRRKPGLIQVNIEF